MDVRRLGSNEWMARDGDVEVGRVVAFVRPDGRTFLQFDGADAVVAALALEAADSLGCVHATAPDGEALDALLAAGFRIELSQEAFRVPFDLALRRLRRASMPADLLVLSAIEVDIEQLVSLDDALRQLVPGTEGWKGSVDLMRSELHSPEFEPEAYLVATHSGSGRHAGLVRIWRNDDGPRFGMIAVLPEFRRPGVAAGLAAQALHVAATWGHDTFVTETAVTNLAVHPLLVRLGAEATGRFHRLIFAGAGPP